MHKIKTKYNKRKLLIILLLVFVVATTGILALSRTRSLNIFNNNTAVDNSYLDENEESTSDVPSAKSDYNSGDNRQPIEDNSINKGTSVILDNNGSISNSIDTSRKIVSTSGEIALYSPSQGATIVSGQAIAGESNLQKVTYRILDDITGMIAMGDLNVVNGKFSGNINFSTSAKEGRIDIFATKIDGSEYSSIEVPVYFR